MVRLGDGAVKEGDIPRTSVYRVELGYYIIEETE
jgi:hypothetical protein